MSWNPVEEPFRVRIISPSSVYGLYGWADTVKTFRTRQDAEKHIDALPKYKGRIEIQLDIAANLETWMKNGKWKRLLTIKK